MKLSSSWSPHDLPRMLLCGSAVCLCIWPLDAAVTIPGFTKHHSFHSHSSQIRWYTLPWVPLSYTHWVPHLVAVNVWRYSWVLPRVCENPTHIELSQQVASKSPDDCLPSCSKYLKCAHKKNQKAALIPIKSACSNVKMKMYAKFPDEVQVLMSCQDKLPQTRVTECTVL